MIGNESTARQRLEQQKQLHARAPSSWTAYTLAVLHAALGEADDAARWLAAQPRHAFVAWLAPDPLVERLLRDHPAFEDMLRQLELQESSCCYRTGSSDTLPRASR